MPKLQNEVISEDHLPKKESKQTTSKEVKTAITNLITRKASDENGIISEHYKYAIDEVTEEIVKHIDQTFHDLGVPQSIRNGILTSVLKWKKDKTIPGNIRGIVVTNIFSKFFETIVKDQLETNILPSQNPLQRGFTEGASSIFIAFITTETMLLYCLLKVYLELVALDAEKASDTVNHEIMLSKLFHDGIENQME